MKILLNLKAVTVKTSGNPFIKLMDNVLCSKSDLKIKQVNEFLYRGSDPKKNFSTLSASGVKVILNLKTISKKELEILKNEAEKCGIEYVNIPLNPFSIKKSIPALLGVINQSSKEKPLFVHCTFGRDRTGFVTALCRTVKEKLPLKEALVDMHQNGFRRVFFHMENVLKKLFKESSDLCAKP